MKKNMWKFFSENKNTKIFILKINTEFKESIRVYKTLVSLDTLLLMNRFRYHTFNVVTDVNNIFFSLLFTDGVTIIYTMVGFQMETIQSKVNQANKPFR